MLDLERDVSGAVFDALTFGVIALDGKGRVIGWNEWLTSASGIPAKNALGSRPEEIFGTPGARVLASAVAAALELGTTRLLTHALHPGLLPLKTRAGQELIHDVSVQAIAGQAQTRCLVQITDVTVHAQRERVLRERQNARYDAVVETAPDAILTLDSRSIIRLANPAAARAFGYGPNELLGEPIASLIGEQKPWDEAWKAVVSGEPLTRPVEIAIRRKDGSRTFVEASASRWLSESRVFVTTILHDVSERRAAEDALRNLNQELERRVEARTAERDRMWRLSTDVMMVARLDGIIEAVNPAWTQLFGWTDDKVIGSSVKDFIDPKIARRSQRCSTRCRTAARPSSSNCRCARATAKYDGSNGAPLPPVACCMPSAAT
jgi:PAS domain S-box-containing protein